MHELVYNYEVFANLLSLEINIPCFSSMFTKPQLFLIE